MADQIDRLIFQVSGRDSGGSKVLSDASKHADAAHTSFSRLGSTLSGMDGPFGQVTSAAGTLGDALQGTTGFATKLGLGLTAAGVGLIAFAAKDQQAQRQLQQSIQNTGASYSDYRGQIEEAIKSQERNAHTADDTQNALNTLTTATQDASTSLSEMNLVADIAAAKHETLAEAATQLVQAQAGNTRAFKSFGIVLDGTGTKTDQINRALKELQDRLSGQAAASVDTFTGRLKVAATQLEDNIAKLGKYGPEITAAGVALTVYAGLLQLKAARTTADTVATQANTRAELANAEARVRTGEAATVEAGAIQRSTLTQAEGAGGMGMLGRFGKGALIAGAGYYGSQAAGSAVGGTSGRYLSDIGGGAAIGAGIGSVVPGVGTAVGAGVGAAVGLGSALLHHAPSTPNGAIGQTDASYQNDLSALKRLQAAAAVSTGQLHQVQLVAIKDAEAALKAADANRQYAKALTNEASAAKTATVGIDGQLAALNKSVTAALTLSDAEDGMRKAMHNAAQAAHDGGTALKGHTQAAIDNRDALRAVVKQEQDVLTAMRAHGASADKVRAAAIAMSKAIQHNATEIYGSKTAVDSLLSSLGAMPGQMSRALVSFDGFARNLNAWGANLANAAFNWGNVAGTNFDAGWASGISAGGSPTSDPNPNHNPGNTQSPTNKAAKKSGQQIGTAIVNGAAPVIDTGIAAAQTKALSKASQRAQAMAALEKQTVQQVAGAYRQARDQIVAGFDVTNLPQKTDLFGTSYTAGRVDQVAHQFVRQLEEWAHLLGRLRKKGLNPVMIDQFEAAGVAAIPAMREVLRDHEVGSLNRSERHIQRISSRVAGAQVAANEGAHLDRVLARLPQRFADAMEHKFAHMHVNVQVEDVNKHQGKKVRVH